MGECARAKAAPMGYDRLVENVSNVLMHNFLRIMSLKLYRLCFYQSILSNVYLIDI